MLSLSLRCTPRHELVMDPAFETCFPTLEKKREWMSATLRAIGDRRRGWRSDMDAVAAEIIDELRVKALLFYRDEGKKIVEEYSELEVRALEGRLMKACLTAWVYEQAGLRADLATLRQAAAA